MKLLLVLLLLISMSSFAQIEAGFSPSSEIGLGYGMAHDGILEVNGIFFHLDGTRHIAKNSSVSARVGLILIKKTTDTGIEYMKIREKNSALNLELEYNYYFRFGNLELFPSAGLAFLNNESVRVREYFETEYPDGSKQGRISYAGQLKSGLGYTFGANVQFQISPSIRLGFRASRQDFFGASHGDGYFSIGPTLRKQFQI